MSTTFGVQVEFDDAGVVETDDGRYFVEVAFRSSNGIRFTNPLAALLPDEIEVVALDNTPQGIYTIGDIKREINGV